MDEALAGAGEGTQTAAEVANADARAPAAPASEKPKRWKLPYKGRKRGRKKKRKPFAEMSRQMKWKIRQYQRGNCINCGSPRGKSPYKRKCVDCARADTEKNRKKRAAVPWKPGMRGRPSKLYEAVKEGKI